MAKTKEQGTELLDPKQQPARMQLIDGKVREQALALDRVAGEYALAITEAQGHVEKALLVARGISTLRQRLTGEIMTEVMALMNSPLGFLTDRGPHAYSEKNRTPYDVGVVRDCLIESLLLGLYPAGNEWNIISGRCYVTVNGWKRKLEELPGISDVRIAPGIPTLHNGQMVCRVALSWKLDGTPDQLVGPDGKPGHPFPIITHGGGTPDQTIGKARRKAYRMAYEKATGSPVTAADGDVSDPAERLPGPSRGDEVAGRLAARGNGDGAGPATEAQRQGIDRAVMDLEMSPEDFAGRCREMGVDPAHMTAAQAGEIEKWLQGLLRHREPSQA